MQQTEEKNTKPPLAPTDKAQLYAPMGVRQETSAGVYIHARSFSFSLDCYRDRAYYQPASCYRYHCSHAKACAVDNRDHHTNTKPCTSDDQQNAHRTDHRQRPPASETSQRNASLLQWPLHHANLSSSNRVHRCRRDKGYD